MKIYANRRYKELSWFVGKDIWFLGRVTSVGQRENALIKIKSKHTPRPPLRGYFYDCDVIYIDQLHIPISKLTLTPVERVNQILGKIPINAIHTASFHENWISMHQPIEAYADTDLFGES